MTEQRSELRLYTTSSGMQVAIKPIHAKTLDDLSLQWEKVVSIKPPVYAVTLAGGETQELEHDSTTLETTEDRQAWDKYVAELNAAIVAHNEASIKTLVTFGIDTDPPKSGWQKDFEFCGLEIPKDPAERKVFYFQRVVLTDPVDEQLIVRKINLISRLSGEALERADALFRGAMEGSGGLDTAAGTADQSGEVETR